MYDHSMLDDMLTGLVNARVQISRGKISIAINGHAYTCSVILEG